MAVIYFAKVNINSNIYDVYKNPSLINKILNKLLQNINSKSVPIKIGRNERIAFFDIERNLNDNYIMGRLARIFKDDIEIYNNYQNNVELFASENVVKSALFFFDLKTETIAFMTPQNMSHKNFIEYFKILLNSYTKDVQFEIFLKTNSGELKKQLARIKKVSEVNFTVIPPNGNENEFNDLFPKNGDEIKETRAIKVQQTLFASKKDGGLNMESSLLKRIFNFVLRGFGTIKITGETEDNHTLRASNDNMPHKVIVADKLKDNANEFKSCAQSEIKNLADNKDTIKG